MVKDRLLQPDAQEKGWLLDGYPRSLEQAKALEELGIRPDIFILLDVRNVLLLFLTWCLVRIGKIDSYFMSLLVEYCLHPSNRKQEKENDFFGLLLSQ